MFDPFNPRIDHQEFWFKPDGCSFCYQISDRCLQIGVLGLESVGFFCRFQKIAVNLRQFFIKMV